MANILVVDDDIDVRGFLLRLLQDAEHTVECATNAAHALEIWKRDARRRSPAFDLVITDLHMLPGVDGIELALQLRKIFPGLPVILLSGDDIAPTEWGDQPYVRKPLSGNELLAEVEVALTSSRNAPPTPPRSSPPVAAPQ